MNRSKHILTVFNLFLIAILCYTGVDLFYNVVFADFVPGIQVYEPSSPVEEQHWRSSGYKRPVRTPFSHYSTIFERDLFKAKAVPVTPRVVQNKNIEALEKTELNLKLWGTVTGAKGNTFAVIEETTGNRSQRRQMLYQKGDEVQGAVIDRILDEKVVLSLNGEQEILEMEERTGNTGRRGRYQPRQTASSSKPVHQKRRLRRSQIENTMANLNDVMKQIRIYPHKDGIKVSHIKSSSIFRKMGLRNGDIITGVNGQQMNSVEDAMGLYEQLQNSSDVSVQIKRRGREQVIDYTIM